MNEEIEALYALLGVKPDEASVAESVDKLVKAVQSKLKSSIYGGKDGVITLPATIEGKFKNGKEINKDIKDAYAAIYEQAKKMADESVSLTLDDLKNFKTQIDKFGKKTAKYRGSDVIANANNNLRQTLSDYQDFINGLKSETAKIQKTQTKQAQKVKAQQKAKTKKAYHGITDEEIDDAIAKENARQSKIKAWRDKQAEQLASKLDVRSGSIDAGRTNKKEAMASEFSEYSSNWARELAKALKENYSTKLTKHFYDKEFKEGPKGSQSRATTKEEYLNALSTQAIKELSGLMGKVEKGKEDVTFDQIVEAIGVVRTLFEENGKSMDTIAKSITTAIQGRYDQPQDTQPDDHGDRKRIYKKDRYGNRIGGIDAEEGTARGVGAGHDKALEYQKSINNLLKKLLGEVNDLSEQEKQANKVASEIMKETKKSNTKKTKNSAYEKAKTQAKSSDASADTKKLAEEIKKGNNKDDKAELNKLNTSINNVKAEVKTGTKATNTQTTYDKMDNVKKDTDEAKHRQVDEVNRDINKDVARSVKQDEVSGFNTDTKADELINLVRDILSVLQGKKVQKATEDATQKALPPAREMQETMQKSLGELNNEWVKSGKYTREQIDKMLADESNRRKGKRNEPGEPITNGPEPPKGLTGNVPPPPEPEPYKNKVEKSTIYASPIKRTIRDAFQNIINDITGASKMYKETINASNEKQDEMAAERVRIWGMNNGRNPNDTGDIAAMRRILELYRNNKASIEQNPELMQKIKLTEGVKIDTTELTKVFNKALSGKQMRNAQMGGSPMKQILGVMRGFTFMPSVEKSRAQADGLNQILGNINKALNSVLANIQMHETTLAGMEKAGDVEFDDNGYITKGTSAAKKTLADLEESKYVLETIMADLLANEKIIKRTGNDYGQMTKQLSFTSPVLRDNNAILRNMNAGLDKNGKALKFQTRMAEILNYTFQLIGRSIGQWLKKLISMLNPLNILKNTIKTITGWVKGAFQDFGSYDTKWQRTMNVIKINFQRAIKPAMEWIAQKLVNIIGFFNIISMKVQEAFGQVPVDLFDQAGANAEKMRRELEEAANVTAGFDELHDIGSDNSGANDLLGDIYKPQLSDEWKAMAEEIGDLFAGLIKGEKTVGEVFGRIFEMLLDLLGKIAKAIWDWFKQTSLGKWITEHWKGLLATLLTLFLGWQLLKIFGPTLLSTIGGAFKTLLIKIGGWMTTLLGASGFGQGIMLAFQSLFAGGKYSLLGTLGEMFTNSAAITQAGSWGSMIGFAVTKGLLAVLAGYATYKITDFFGDKAVDNKNYNLGLMAYGGKEEDKKSNVGNILGGVLTGVGGGAATGAIIGGPIGAVVGGIIGGIAGTLQTVLKPALEEAQVAARDMNNELQNINYYEGAVKGAESVVDDFTEKLNLSNDTVDAQKDKVYKLGEKYDVSKTELDKLVKSIEDGSYQTEMSAGYNDELSTALDQLDWHYKNNKDLSDKLTEAKKKLAKAELDLSIASDIEAGNFELAAARIEYAMASDLYTTDEAAAKMAQIMKETSFTEATELLNNCSPELQKKWNEYTSDIEQGKKDITDIFSKMSESERDNLLKSNNNDLKQKWFTYATTTREGKKELAKMYSEMNDEERRAFEKDYSAEAGGAMSKAIQAMQREINSASWDWSHPFKSLMSTFSGDWSWKAKYASFDVGTNYVPNDGFAYIHKGEAIIPADQNVFADQGKAFSTQSMTNEELVQAIRELKVQMQQGVNVKGQFVQRGSDLVATVEKANNRMKNNVLNNKVYAR